MKEKKFNIPAILVGAAGVVLAFFLLGAEAVIAGVIGLVLVSAVGRLLMYYCSNDQWRWLCLLPWLPIVLYSLIIFVHSSLKNKSAYVGLLSIPAAFVQLMGYGLGFIKAWWKRCVLGQDEFTAFEKNFYK